MLCYFWVYHNVTQLLLFSRSAMSDSLWPHGLWPSGLLCPRDFPGKNTWVGCHFLLLGILSFKNFLEFGLWDLSICISSVQVIYFLRYMKILPSMTVFTYPLVIQRFFFSLEIPKLCLTICWQNDTNPLITNKQINKPQKLLHYLYRK